MTETTRRPEAAERTGGFLLEARHLTRTFPGGRRPAVDDVSFGVRPGECLAVVGGSGSGKTTVTRILLGLETADSGEATFDGMPVLARRPAAMRRLPGWRALRRQSGLVLQDPLGSLDPRWTVARSVAEPLTLLPRADRPDAGRIAERVDGALRTVGLDPDAFRGRRPATLSGGQAQRVALARALAPQPRVILADEPMSALDVDARVRILDAFAAIRRQRPGMALVVVSHDLGVVGRLADRIVVLHEGRLVESGSAGRILDDPHDPYTRALVDAARL